jgi:hypothetical protein
VSKPFDEHEFLAALDTNSNQANEWDHLLRQEDSDDDELRESLAAYHSARRGVFEQIGFIAPDPSILTPLLDQVGNRLADLCALLRRLGRNDRYGVLDHDRIWRMQRTDGASDDDVAMSYKWAKHLVEEALAQQPLADKLKLGWGGKDWQDKRGSILRSAMQYVDLILGNLAGYFGCHYLPLSREGVCALAADLSQRFERAAGWTAIDLSRAGFDLNRLDLALGQLHVKDPRPTLSGPHRDTWQRAVDKLEQIVRTLSKEPAPESPAATAAEHSAEPNEGAAESGGSVAKPEEMTGGDGLPVADSAPPPRTDAEILPNGPYSAGRFRWGDEVRDLTPKPWRILEVMWSAFPSRSFSFEDIAEAIYRDDPDADAAKRRIKPHVSTINGMLDGLPQFRHRLQTFDRDLRWRSAE